MNDDYRKNGSFPFLTGEFVIYVEGKTDFNFLSRFESKRFEPQLPNFNFDEAGNKEWILNAVKNSKFKNIYGIVDKDFDDPNDIRSYVNRDYIFVTDTHDLETLLLSTENKLVSKTINGFLVLSEEDKETIEKDYYTAKYIAYQIGIINKILPVKIYNFKSYLNYNRVVLNDYHNCINFDSIIENNELKRKQYLDEIKKHRGDHLFVDEVNFSIKKLGQNNEKIKKAKDFKMLIELLKSSNFFSLDSESGKYIFNKTPEETLKLPDLWDIINGHDICEILFFLNEKISNFYREFRKGEFENDLAAYYDREIFVNTVLYKSMKKKKMW